MELSDILALLDRFDASTAGSMKLRLGDLRLELNKAAAPAAMSPAAAVPAAATAPVPAAAAAETQPEGTTVKAPLVGTFYAASAPREAPFVSVGDQVKKGQTVCLMEAMKMMNEVTAPCDCVIEALLQEDGALVSFGAPLLRYKAV